MKDTHLHHLCGLGVTVTTGKRADMQRAGVLVLHKLSQLPSLGGGDEPGAFSCIFLLSARMEETYICT
jgi:hypothetical protein